MTVRKNLEFPLVRNQKNLTKGEINKATESVILNTTGVHFIARIPFAKEVNSTFIQDQSEVFKEYFQS